MLTTSWIFARRRTSISCSILIMTVCSDCFFSFSHCVVRTFNLEILLTRLPWGSPGTVRDVSAQTDLTRLLKESSLSHCGLNLKGCLAPKRPTPICKQMVAWSERKGRFTQAWKLQDGERNSSAIKTL